MSYIYMNNIFLGTGLFLLFIILSIVPYAIYAYRKEGGLFFNNIFVRFSFILYLIIAFLMVVAPFPSIETVKNMTGPTYNIVPFQFITDFFRDSGFNISDTSTYLKALKSASFYTVAFNLLLFFPLGVYLRKYFRLSLTKTILSCFLVSLFFEITQLTGIYGIYPRAYRLFDIDDLFINTLGGFLGAVSAKWIAFILPELIAKKSITDPLTTRVSYTRRVFAFCIDLIIITGISILANLNFDIKSEPISEYLGLALLLFYFICLSYFWKGKTLGKALLKMRLGSFDATRPKLLNILIRYFWIGFIILDTSFSPRIIHIAHIIVVFYTLFSIITKKKYLFYETMSKTRNFLT